MSITRFSLHVFSLRCAQPRAAATDTTAATDGGTLQLAKIVEDALPSLISKIDVLQGDGGAGTVIELFFALGMVGGLKSYKEKFTVVDEEKRVKESEVVEGGPPSSVQLRRELLRIPLAS